MAWLVKTLSSPFHEEAESSSKDQNNDKPRGVKEDLTQITDAFKKQLRVAANFIAPPPAASDLENRSKGEEDTGAQDDLQLDFQISQRVKTGFSKITGALQSTDGNNIQNTITDRLAGITKFASKILTSDEDVVGVSEEVLSFAAQVSQHPGTWLNFPLNAIEEPGQEFTMSEVQQEHALTVEHLTPSLAALKSELCPYYMKEGQFWKIYFVLVHSLLSKEDALILSTPEIMEARALLSEESHSRYKTQPANVEDNVNGSKEGEALQKKDDKLSNASEISQSIDPKESSGVSSAKKEEVNAKDVELETDKASAKKEELNVKNVEIDKASAQKEGLNSKEVEVEKANDKISDFPNKKADESKQAKVEHNKEEAEADDWLEESSKDEHNHASTKFSNEDDVSFSDLEDDD
eukprot:TRINITY_DN38067_c0_g1_i1.p1 TRINITY_DN38067_c0_g1~~TRINITY_DN38067_c0_g1_i1.p1  ORF type:complete len:450 (+),score=111.39 TRINITY_DN38067_c0_g1_i1:127-1350(+)